MNCTKAQLELEVVMSVMATPFTVDTRRWRKGWAVLDLAAKPVGFGVWCNRARRWLPGGRPGVERLLGLVRMDAREPTPSREAKLLDFLPNCWSVAD